MVRGVFLGEALEASVARLEAQGRIELAPDFENLAVRLKAGRIQAAIVPSTIHIKQMADGELGTSIRVIDMPEAEPFPVGLYLHHNVPAADLELLQRHLRALVSEGAVESVYAQFLRPKLARRLFSKSPHARH